MKRLVSWLRRRGNNWWGNCKPPLLTRRAKERAYAAIRRRHALLLRFECLEQRLALSATTTLDWNGPDEPFYTPTGVGATISLAEVNSLLATAGIGLSVHSANEPTWEMRDCCGGNRFLLGNQAFGPGGDDGPADFFANFLNSAATRVALEVGYFTAPASARLTAYAEPIATGSMAELAGLTEVASQILHINGSSQNGFSFDLDLTQPGRSFVVEIFNNSTGPAINQIEWDSAAVSSTTFAFANDSSEYALDALVPGATSLLELNRAYSTSHGFHNQQFIVGKPVGGQFDVVAADEDVRLQFTADDLNAVGWWVNSRSGWIYPAGSTLGVGEFDAGLVDGFVTFRAFEERIVGGTFTELASLSVVAEITVPLGSSTIDGDFELPANARSFTLHLSDAEGNFITGPAVTLGSITLQTDSDPVPPPAIGPLPTEVGQWHQFRGDSQLTGRATLTGNVTEPEVLWTEFIGARRTHLALHVDGSPATQFELPTASSSMSPAEQVAWQIGLPRYDLDGNGTLTAIAPSVFEKVGNFLPESPGLERVTASFEGSSTDGRVRLYTRNGSGGWKMEWVSDVIPMVEFGPNLIVEDVDNNGHLDVVLTPWYNTYVLDIHTGAVKYTGSFNPPGSESGRPYGWFGAHDLNNNGRKELIVLGDFENKIGVVGWNNGQLTTLWTRLIEPGVEKKQTVFHPGVDPVADVTGNGVPEIVVSVYNETGDQRWHVLVLDGMTGNVLLDLPEYYLQGLEDINGDGKKELFLTRSPEGPAPSISGDIKILDFGAGNLTTLWEMSGTGFSTAEIQNFPLNVNSGAGTGRTTLLTGSIDPSEPLPVFFTQQTLDATTQLVEVTAWRYDGAGGMISLASAAGTNIEVIATRVGSPSLPQILLAVEVLGDPTGETVWLDSATAVVAASTLFGPGQTSVVVGDLASTGHPTIVVSAATGQLIAFEANPWTGETSTQWAAPGRGEYAGSSNFQGQHGIGNVVVADLLGNGRLATIAATSNEIGHARIAALDPLGNELWHTDFPFPGDPPEWNVGGLTTFKTGHFRSPYRQDVLVSLRQSTMHSDVYFLLDGETGEVVWTRDWGNTPGVGSHDRGAGGSQLAVYDWNGNGLDEAINIYPDVYYVVNGSGVNLRDRNLANGAAYPGIWPQGGIPIVYDFLGNGTSTVLHTGSSNVVGLLTDLGNPVWHVPGSYSQFSAAVLDFNGNGSLEFFLDGAVYSAINGELLYTVSLPGSPSSAVSADMDGDGRDEAIVTIGNRLFVIGYNPTTNNATIEWSMTFDSALGMPIVADSNGNGQLEIIVVSSSGTVYGVGQQSTGIPSDFDGDGYVDGHDFLAWQRGFGSTGQTDNSNGDADGNGIVDAADLTIWESQFGIALPESQFVTASLTAVPEPDSSPLLATTEPSTTPDVMGPTVEPTAPPERTTAFIQSLRPLDSPMRTWLKPLAQPARDAAFSDYDSNTPLENNWLLLAEETSRRSGDADMRFDIKKTLQSEVLQVGLMPPGWLGLDDELDMVDL